MSTDNPFAAPSFDTELAMDQQQLRDYGGLRRLPYFGYAFLVGIINNILQQVAISAGIPELLIVLGILGLVATLWLAVQRLKNLGYSGWWAIGLIVPILNILVGLRCLACPEGYADHKTLDTAGKTIIGLFFGLIILAIAVVALVASR
ncbi:MAG: DUF805 domain-containing protein [Planctomycetaceae bacterium]|nr:DUF805 domain-containing protein [Planctomycetaceae bacterium]